VFAAPVASFSFFAQESAVHGGAPAQAALIRFLARRAGTSRETFEREWDTRHAPLAIRCSDASGAVRRYVHDRLGGEPPAGHAFDGISEQWFDDVDAARAALASAPLAPIEADLERFADLSRSLWLLTRVVHRWPKT
jgi:uncharacterized protein (TIGR02118 family)